MGNERENSYRKLKRSPEERHTQIHRNILMITDVFLNKKRVNVCEYMVKESIYLMTIAKEELIFISLLLVSTGIF